MLEQPLGRLARADTLDHIEILPRPEGEAAHQRPRLGPTEVPPNHHANREWRIPRASSLSRESLSTSARPGHQAQPADPLRAPTQARARLPPQAGNCDLEWNRAGPGVARAQPEQPGLSANQ